MQSPDLRASVLPAWPCSALTHEHQRSEMVIGNLKTSSWYTLHQRELGEPTFNPLQETYRSLVKLKRIRDRRQQQRIREVQHAH
jgi:hypothetical protein